MTRNLACRNSGQTDFHQIQLIVWIRAWGLMHGEEKDVPRQIQDLSCLREFVVSSDPRSAPKTAKKPFFLKSHLSWWFLSLGRGSQLYAKLILVVDTSWQWVDTGLLCACAQPMVGAGTGTETLCIMIIVIIIRGNLTFKLSLQKTQLSAAPSRRAFLLGSRTRSRMTNSPRLISAEDLYCQPLKSQYRALQFVLNDGLDSAWNDGFWIA